MGCALYMGAHITGVFTVYCFKLIEIQYLDFCVKNVSLNQQWEVLCSCSKVYH